MDFKVDPGVRRQVLDTVWDNFYANGGWGMYPTTVFGFLLILSACLHLLRPEGRYLPIVVITFCLTAASGILATATGLTIAFRFVQHVEAADQLRVAVLGCAEALNNVILGLILAIVGGMVALAGVVRQRLRRAT
jgi:hypothetical protein